MAHIHDIPSSILMMIARLLSDEEYLLLSQVSKKICFCLTYGCYTRKKRKNLRRIKVGTLIGQLRAIRRNPDGIKYFENPPYIFKVEAIKNYPWSIQYIKDPSEELQLLAVNTNAVSIKHIKNPSEKVQLAAVNKSPWSIKCIENPPEKIQLAAVGKDESSLGWAANPSERVRLSAAATSLASILHIKRIPSSIRNPPLVLFCKIAKWFISTTTLYFY